MNVILKARENVSNILDTFASMLNDAILACTLSIYKKL